MTNFSMEEFSRMGGKARAAKLSEDRRKEIGSLGGAASAVARRAKARSPKINPAVLKKIPND